VISVASGFDVQVGVVPRHRRALRRQLLRGLLHLLEGVVNLLTHKVTLLNPAFDAVGKPDLGKTLLPIDNFNPIPVLRGPDLVVDLRELVAQRDLGGRNVIDFEDTLSMSAASGKQCGKH